MQWIAEVRRHARPQRQHARAVGQVQRRREGPVLVAGGRRSRWCWSSPGSSSTSRTSTRRAQTMQLANIIHMIAALLAIAMACVHIYLGTVGMRGAYRRDAQRLRRRDLGEGAPRVLVQRRDVGQGAARHASPSRRRCRSGRRGMIERPTEEAGTMTTLRALIAAGAGGGVLRRGGGEAAAAAAADRRAEGGSRGKEGQGRRRRGGRQGRSRRRPKTASRRATSPRRRPRARRCRHRRWRRRRRRSPPRRRRKRPRPRARRPPRRRNRPPASTIENGGGCPRFRLGLAPAYSPGETSSAPTIALTSSGRTRSRSAMRA